MIQIVCTDVFGEKHDVEFEDMKLFTSAYGIHIVGETVLMVQDRVSGQWRFPGGRLNKIEREWEGMKRGISLEAGINITSNVKLVHIMEEDYYDLYLSQGCHVTSMFYLISEIEGGTLQTTGENITNVQYLPIKDVEHFSDKEIKKKHKEIFKQSREKK